MKYGLGIEITGAADKATGTEMTNSNPCSLWASFFVGCLKEKDIDDYTLAKANWIAIVRLFLP